MVIVQEVIGVRLLNILSRYGRLEFGTAMPTTLRMRAAVDSVVSRLHHRNRSAAVRRIHGELHVIGEKGAGGHYGGGNTIYQMSAELLSRSDLGWTGLLIWTYAEACAPF